MIADADAGSIDSREARFIVYSSSSADTFRRLYVPPSSKHRGQPRALSENGPHQLVGGKRTRRVASQRPVLWDDNHTRTRAG